MPNKQNSWNNWGQWTYGEWIPCTLTTISTPITTTVDIYDTHLTTTDILTTNQLNDYSDYLSMEIDRNIQYSEYISESLQTLNTKKSVLKGSTDNRVNNIVRDLQSLIDDEYITDILFYHNNIELVLSNMNKMPKYLEVLQEVNYLVDSNKDITIHSFSTTIIILTLN